MGGRTQYVKTDDGVHVAYRVEGDGPIDLLFVPGFASHIELYWESDAFGPWLRVLARATRLIMFDKRGTGRSDRVSGPPSLERRMADVRAVLDEVGSERAALFGMSEGGPMSILYTATYPERVTSLVLCGSFARNAWAPDYPWGTTVEQQANRFSMVEQLWGTGHVAAAFFAEGARDADELERMAHAERNSASPGSVIELIEMVYEIDVRPLLPTITVPTLVMGYVGDPVVPIEHSRYLAEHIPDAKLLEFAGDAHASVGANPPFLAPLMEFVTGEHPIPETERVLATVMFTDIVGSTERAAASGDGKWRALLDRHDDVVRRCVSRFRGREVKHTGDGFLAVFDGPARAVECGVAAIDAVRQVGLEIRVGVHTGECTVQGDDVGGLAVHLAARVVDRAGANEVLVTRTVKDLVFGSGLTFDGRGAHELKGFPEPWELFAARLDTASAPPRANTSQRAP